MTESPTEPASEIGFVLGIPPGTVKSRLHTSRAELRKLWQQDAAETGGPLYEAIVEEARKGGLAGATVWKGTMGFGAHSRMHTARILRLSEDLPVVIEIVDAAEKLEAFVHDHLDQMVQEGHVTLERGR